MLKRIEEFGKYVMISGLRNIKISDADVFLKMALKEKAPDVEVQFFDARYVVTWQHLYFAALNALKAFANEENISKSLAMETMLYGSAQRQITKAVKLLGIKPKASEIGLLIIGDNFRNVESALSTVSANAKAQPDDRVLELSDEKKKTIQKVYGISDTEVDAISNKDGLEETLTDLIIERMALLATQH